jgi:hypothetical protein
MALLQKIWNLWQRFGRFIGNLVGRVILSIFYFTIMLPFSLGATLLGDMLKIKQKDQPYWVPRQPLSDSLEQARRQF